MVIKTFEAEISGGQLRHDERLEALEGRRVQVIVTAPDEVQDSSVADHEPDSCEPPDWLDVERDVYVPMRGKIEVINDVTIIDRGPGSPTIILPEDLPDD